MADSFGSMGRSERENDYEPFEAYEDDEPGTPWDAYATNRGPTGFEADEDDEMRPGSRMSKEGGVVAQVGRLGVAALAGLVVADVILVTLAVGHVRSDKANLTRVNDEPKTTQTAGSQDPTPKPTTKPTKNPGNQTPTLDPAASRMLVDIGQGDAVGRATSGSCGAGGGKLELSRDGGQTFEKADLPSAEVVLRLAVTNIDEARVVVADKTCETITTFASDNGGSTWFVDEETTTWHKSAKPGASVHAPNGDVDVPCGDGASVLGLSTLGNEQAYALCSDGTVARTDNGGSDWEKQGTAKGAADLDFIDAESGLAVVTGAKGCAGIAVMKTTDSGEEWSETGCVETDVKEMADISADGESAYIAAGNAVWFSDDGGESWEPRSE
jgi:hypothetical protein